MKNIYLYLATLCFFAAVRAQNTPSPSQTFGVDAKLFQFTGDWAITEANDASGGSCLSSGPKGAKLPAATAINIPAAGRYFLWVRAMDFPNDRPGTRTFSVSVGGQKSAKVFGTSGKPGFTWEAGGAFELREGSVLLGIYSLAPYARVDAILLTTNAAFTPSLRIGEPQHPLVRPIPLAVPAAADPLASVPVTKTTELPSARLENEFVRMEYLPATCDGKETVDLQMATRTTAGWTSMPVDPSSEIYTVIAAGTDTQLGYSDFYPVWGGDHRPQDTVTVEAGGTKLETSRAVPQVIWNAGQIVRFLPQTARMDSDCIRLTFYPSNLGTLAAEWRLSPGEHTARVRLTFTPAMSGQFALGYHLFFRRPLSDVKEMLLPMMWQRHRFPDQPRTLLDPFTPTPVALAETKEGDQSVVWGLIGDPEKLSFQWPGSARPHFGLMIRDNAGMVQPAIYGPVPGTDAAKSSGGVPLEFSFRVLVQPGDWYTGYRTAADEVFRLRDYRSNVGVSLTDAALNMIDLIMDDAHGGWWDRAKAFYQIESKNGSTEASPLTLLSLYRLTGDTSIYRRRTLPTMEFTLSRTGVHFSPLPQDTGPYDPGGMNGPVQQFGTGVFGGMWEMTQRRTAAFAPIALPENDVRLPGTGSHVQPFDEWLARYELTGDHEALLRACALADAYLAQNVQQPPSNELGEWSFFFVSAVPDWEGLLHLYEATGKKQYLVGAIFGARQLMTGIWTQPIIPPGNVKVNPGGQFTGDNFNSWRGPTHYRLGKPRKPGDTPEHEVPAWMVSNVGLGFEQPSTFEGGTGIGRMIYQMEWAPDFLRLAQYTGDKMFETYARNAVIGRWANYPGYYATGFTDLPLNPRYPYEGPDVTDLYYHHIVPQLAWTIDYLIAEASLRSAGKIHFPAARQDGYTYFDSRVYGHAPGQVYDFDSVWLWLRRGLVTIDNPQINYLTAHNDSQLFLLLMNESTQEEEAMVHFSPDALNFNPQEVKAVAQIRNGIAGSPLPLQNGDVRVTVPSRGLVILQLDHANIHVPTHHLSPKSKAGPYPGYLKLSSDGGDVYAAALQMAPGPWDAYIWSTASPQQASKVSLRYEAGDGWHQIDDQEYPFEFSVPVKEGQTIFRFFIEGVTTDGKEFRTVESVIGVGQ